MVEIMANDMFKIRKMILYICMYIVQCTMIVQCTRGQFGKEIDDKSDKASGIDDNR